MSVFIPATGIENVRALAQSALPNAPVEPDDTKSPGRFRRMIHALRGRRADPTLPIGATLPAQ